MDLDLQLGMFEEALHELDRNDDLVNEVLEIWLSDSSEDFEVLRYKMPAENGRARRQPLTTMQTIESSTRHFRSCGSATRGSMRLTPQRVLTRQSTFTSEASTNGSPSLGKIDESCAAICSRRRRRCHKSLVIRSLRSVGKALHRSAMGPRGAGRTLRETGPSKAGIGRKGVAG
jgi:hypothetical protein